MLGTTVGRLIIDSAYPAPLAGPFPLWSLGSPFLPPLQFNSPSPFAPPLSPFIFIDFILELPLYFSPAEWEKK